MDFAVRIEDFVPVGNSNHSLLLEMKFRGSSIHFRALGTQPNFLSHSVRKLLALPHLPNASVKRVVQVQINHFTIW